MSPGLRHGLLAIETMFVTIAGVTTSTFASSRSLAVCLACLACLGVVTVAIATVTTACGSDLSSENPDGGGSSTTTPPSGSGDAGGTTNDGAPSGVTDGSPSGSDTGAPSTPVCATDTDCNDDPTVKAILGQCFQGFCICKNDSSYLQAASGKCGSKQPGECTALAGECVQQTSKCPAGKLAGDSPENMSCGDLVEAVCCFNDASCKGYAALACCSKSAGTEPPICENGWRTCASGKSPIKQGDVCN